MTATARSCCAPPPTWNASGADDGFPPAILEGFVDFAFEASILVSGDGERYVTFPIVRNVHRNNILHMTIAPAEVPDEVAARAHELARTLADGFKLAGHAGPSNCS